MNKTVARGLLEELDGPTIPNQRVLDICKVSADMWDEFFEIWHELGKQQYNIQTLNFGPDRREQQVIHNLKVLNALRDFLRDKV